MAPLSILNPRNSKTEKLAARLIIAFVLENCDADQTVFANPELFEDLAADPTPHTLFEVLFNLAEGIVQMSAQRGSIEEYVAHLRQCIAEIELAELEADNGHT